MVKNYINFLHSILFFIVLFLIPNTIYSQCAGDDNAFSVCDVSNPANQTINLFSKLAGSPVAGGVWTDDDDSAGLNENTGILNVHLIRASGTYHYTYTVSNVPGCTDNTATIAVTVGGYTGVPSPSVSVCSSVEEFNLFQAFSGEFLGPQSNGQWHNDTTNQNVASVVNVKNLQGTYQYTYTIGAEGSCPAVSSTVILTVFRAPQSGTPVNLFLCGTDGLAGYTNYDLNNSLTGEDSGGTWRDLRNTGELTSGSDHFVDLKKIYDKFGEGDFYFVYTVLPDRPICSTAQSTIRIRLERKLDFTGAVLQITSDICETEIPTAKYSARLTRGNAAIPNGTYNVTFSVSGPKAATEVVTANFTNGVLLFPIKSDYFQQVGSFTVTIQSIIGENSTKACTNIIDNLQDDLIIYPIPNLEGAKITDAKTCQNEEGLVEISNALKLADGTYDIIYSLSGANTADSQVARIIFENGKGVFTIPEILNSKSGTSVIDITAITHVISRCVNSADLKGKIIINPLPNTANLRIQIADVCFGSPVAAVVTGLGTLTDVTLSYTLSGRNTATVQTIVLTSTNGNANFIIPAELLINTGSTTATVRNVKNNITGCSIDVSGPSDAFLLNPIPGAPAADNQPFCKSDKATIANLLPNGAQYKWYISDSSTTPLDNSYLLKSENYYVRQTVSGCTSNATAITVTINDSPAPVLSDPADFCGLNSPTLSDLSNKTNVPLTVVWYDAPVNGNLLPPTTALKDKGEYYAFDSEDCLSYEGTKVIVSLTACDNVPNDFFVPDGFSPNGDGVNDTFVIPDIEFLYPDYGIEIFNRYGNRMYKGYKDKASWDGTNWETEGFAHGIAPNGVYFYILNFNKDNKPPKQGRLYLNR
jgi:gliding motility-associated-like protein